MKTYEWNEEYEAMQEALYDLYGGVYNMTHLPFLACALKFVRRMFKNTSAFDPNSFKLSKPGAFIAGCPKSFDMLVLRKGAKAYMGMVYRPEDVYGIVLCLPDGCHSYLPHGLSLESLIEDVNDAVRLNRKIRVCYLSFRENEKDFQYLKTLFASRCEARYATICALGYIDENCDIKIDEDADVDQYLEDFFMPSGQDEEDE